MFALFGNVVLFILIAMAFLWVFGFILDSFGILP